MAQKRKNNECSKLKPTKQELDPTVKAAIVSGLFTIIVVLIEKLL